MALTDKQLLDLVQQEFDDSLGRPGGEISEERAEAYDYYLSKLFGNETDDDVSTVVTSDVADVVDGIMPSLLRIFTIADNIVSFDAEGPEDVPASEQETDYITYTFFKRNPAFEILFFWFFDALVQKNGIVKCWWDESEEVTYETYKGVSTAGLVELFDDDELEAIEREERQGEVIDPETGQVVTGIVHDIQFRRIRKTGRLVVANVPPEEYRISSDARSLDPSKARMVGHERIVTRSELIEMGFDKDVVMALKADGDTVESGEEASRRDKSDERSNKGRKNPDKSQDEILLREAYIKADVDGDGRAELRQVFTAGEKMLSQEPFDSQPFHVICPSPLPHKHFGRASAEKVMDVQLVGSTLLRQILGNLYHTNNPGHAVWEQALTDDTMDDLLTTRLGRVARFGRPVSDSYAPLTVPFTAKESFPMVEYFDKVKRDRSGVSSDSEGLTPEALKNIQQSVMAEANDISRMKIEAIARIFAETGIKSLFRHMHELLNKHQQKGDVVELRNQWVEVSPKEWRRRFNMTVNVGLGIGTRDRNLVHLNAIWDKQAAMVDAGGMNLTVTPKNIYNTAVEIVKNSRLSNPEFYFTDPGDKSAPPPSREQEALQRQQQELAARQQALDDRDQQIKVQRLEIERRESALKHQRELAEIDRKREKDRDEFFAKMEEISNAITKLEIESGKDIPGSRV